MNNLVEQIALQADLKTNVVWVLVFTGLALVIGSALRAAGLVRRTAGQSQKRIASLVSWWVLFALLVLVLLLGRATTVVLFAAASLLGLYEYRALVRQRMTSMSLWWSLVYLAVPVNYAFIYFRRLDLYWAFIPAWMLLLLLARLVLASQPSGFLEAAGITFLGLMLLVFLLSHAVLFLVLPENVSPAGGSVGLLLFLVVMTASNDIAQALWGRRFGRRKILPAVSPNKTWEGFLLGAATTMALGFVLAGPLTPYADRPMRMGPVQWNVPHLAVLVAGALIVAGGFFGDAVMSAVKREAGVKDSSTLLPGHGGILDRIDSLTFTGPLLYYFTFIFYA